MKVLLSIFTIMMLGLLALLPGCASARLDVTVAVYADDPLLQSLSDPRRLEAIRSAINNAETTANDVKVARIEAAKDLIELYKSYYTIIDAVNRKGEGEPQADAQNLAVTQLERERDRYNYEINQRTDVVISRVADARAALEKLSRITDQWGETKLRSDAYAFLQAIGELDMTVSALNVAINTTTLFATDTVFDEMIKDTFQGTDPESDPGMQGDLRNLLQREDFVLTSEVTEQIDNLAKMIVNMIDKAGKRKIQNAASLQSLQASVDALQSASDTADSGRIVDALNNMAHSALEMLVNVNVNIKELTWQTKTDMTDAVSAASGDFNTSQLDRNQDPADPAWRIISDPNNNNLWHPVFAEAEFYAEGKSEVIFVQDRIGHFRVQRGQNNPAALIAGQARISRAIASGAVNAFAAVSGVSGLPGLSKIGDQPDGEQPAEEPNAANGEAAAQRADTDAELEAKSRRVSRERKALLKQLRQNRARIAATAVDTDVTTEVYEQLKAVISAYNKLFGPS